MAEIIQFPSHEQKRIRLRNRLHKMITSMDDYYDQIDDIMASLVDLEDAVSKVEIEYGVVLREYARAGEKAKIETRLLAYCRDADVVWDGDKQELTFYLEKMNLEEEDPA